MGVALGESAVYMASLPLTTHEVVYKQYKQYNLPDNLLDLARPGGFN